MVAARSTRLPSAAPTRRIARRPDSAPACILRTPPDARSRTQRTAPPPNAGRRPRNSGPPPARFGRDDRLVVVDDVDASSRPEAEARTDGGREVEHDPLGALRLNVPLHGDADRLVVGSACGEAQDLVELRRVVTGCLCAGVRGGVLHR